MHKLHICNITGQRNQNSIPGLIFCAENTIFEFFRSTFVSKSNFYCVRSTVYNQNICHSKYLIPYLDLSVFE